MLNNVDLTFITPQTAEEFQRYYSEFEFLHHFFPFKLSADGLKQILDSRIGNCTLVYANSILIGSFMLDIFKNSVELHGIARPDMAKIVHNHKRVKLYIYQLILSDVFDFIGKDKLVIKAEDYNKGVRGFALMYGFNKLKNKDKGRNVWVLTKQQYGQRKQNG